jgi:hypothetical protein
VNLIKAQRDFLIHDTDSNNGYEGSETSAG